MPTLRHSLEADCPPASLWAVLADLSSVARTNPLVTSASVTGAAASGIGATRHCTLAPKGTVTERVWAFEEGRAIGFEVIQSDWPVRMMRWKTTVEPRGGGSGIHQTLDYQTKFGPLGRLLDLLVLRRALRKNVGAALAGVIREAEARR